MNLLHLVRIAAAGALIAWFCRAHLPKFDREAPDESVVRTEIKNGRMVQTEGMRLKNGEWKWSRVWSLEDVDETFPTVHLGEHRRALENYDLATRQP